MGLENPSYISQLLSANPGVNDQRHEGDDHLRNIKQALLNTFPGLGGRAWRTRVVQQSGPINSTDNMTLLNCTGGITLTPAAAATLGNGFMCYVRAASGGVTIDPSEPINGAASFVVPSGYICILFCDGSAFFTLLTYQDVPPSVPVFPSGTKLTFNQTTPPLGWTKLTTSAYNNAGFRSTTGTVGTGGLDDFTTTFGTGKSTAGFSLSAGHNGPHSHNLAGGSPVLSGGGSDLGVPGGGGTASQIYGSPATDSSGSGTAHAHSLTGMNLKYVDLIVASKD